MSFRSRNLILVAAVLAVTAPLAAQAASIVESSNVQQDKPVKKVAKPRLTPAQKNVLYILNSNNAKYAFEYSPALLATVKSGAAKGLWTYTRNAEGTEHDMLVVFKA